VFSGRASRWRFNASVLGFYADFWYAHLVMPQSLLAAQQTGHPSVYVTNMYDDRNPNTFYAGTVVGTQVVALSGPNVRPQPHFPYGFDVESDRF
jgi:hypothetical protein